LETQIKRILDLSNAFGPSGHEDEVLEVAKAALPKCAQTSQDTIHNLYIDMPKTSTKASLLLDAHSDEVGFIIQSVREDGCMTFLPLGGWRPESAVGAPVVILNADDEKIKAVISSRPVHYGSSGKELSFDELVIDAGFVNAQEAANAGIEPGNFVAPDVECIYDEKRGVFLGKAFDCRIGCAALIETLHRLQNTDLPINVQGILSAQEEVGERGMMAAVNNLDAAVAICFEGCPADDTFGTPLKQTVLKKGPMLRHFDRSMITHPKFQKFALDLAKEHNIPVQRAVRSGGGTNGGILHTHNIPTIVIGIPVRYAHSSVGYCALEDYENAVQLACLIASSLNEDVLASFC
jgi:putative aminopeptidase FrvX